MTPIAQPELIHRTMPDDEWCVTLNGQRALVFSGPGAKECAQRQFAELAARVSVQNTQLGDSTDERLSR
jgi:hypothetical protein